MSKTKGCANIPTLESFSCYSPHVQINPLKMNDVKKKMRQFVAAEIENFHEDIFQ